MVEAVLERDEGVDRLAGELVVDAYDGGFGYGVCFAVLVMCCVGRARERTVLDECGFDLGGGETVAGDVDDVVDAAADPVVAFVVATRAIARELQYRALASPG